MVKITASSGYKGEPSLRRPPSKEFKCREVACRRSTLDDDDVPMINFECTLPSGDSVPSKTLTFACRSTSVGVLYEKEETASKEQKEEVESIVDPFFFESGYSLAGKTGWQIWPGTRIAVDCLLFPQPDVDSPRLKFWQQQLNASTRILELGSGVGVVGTQLAAVTGAQVLETDLEILVENSTRLNLLHNSELLSQETDAVDTDSPPAWLKSAEPIRMGPQGWVGSAALDWTKPVADQLSEDQCQVDVIIACDCVWMKPMLQGVMSTLEQLFELRNSSGAESKPTLLISFQRRDPAESNKASSEIFTTVDEVLGAIHQRKWSVECLAWTPVHYQDKYSDKEDEVFLFEVTP